VVHSLDMQDVKRGRDGLGPALLAGVRDQVQIVGGRPGVDAGEQFRRLADLG